MRLAHLVSGHLILPSLEKQELLEAVDAGGATGAPAGAPRSGSWRSCASRPSSTARSSSSSGGGDAQDFGPGLRAIHREPPAEEADEWAELDDAFRQADLPPHARERADKELSRLRRLNPVAPEAAVIRTYLDWILALPWSGRSQDNLDVRHASEILEAAALRAHRGEGAHPRPRGRALAGQGDARARSSAWWARRAQGRPRWAGASRDALGREFVRVSLGGVRDEAEIRGHRRTYVGALPGRIVQGMRRSGTVEPGLPPGRGGQAGPRLPRRPGRGPSGGAGPGAEPDLHRPLSGAGVRPLRRALHRHGQHPPGDPRAAPRPHGGHPAPGIPGHGEARDRRPLPLASPGRAARPRRPRPSLWPRRPSTRSSTATPGRRGSASWTGASRASPARWRGAWPREARVRRTVAPGRPAGAAGPPTYQPTGPGPGQRARRHRQRAGLDRGRRRGPRRGGGHRPGERQPAPHRHAGRGDEGVGAGGRHLRPVPGGASWGCRRTSTRRWTSTSTSPRAPPPRTDRRRASPSPWR